MSSRCSRVCFKDVLSTLFSAPIPLPRYLRSAFLGCYFLSLFFCREACFGWNRLATTPPPSAFPGWRVSMLFVSVWVRSCRLFVDCAGRQRGGGVGGGCQEDSRQLLTARALFSKLFTVTVSLNRSSVHFTIGSWCLPLPVKIPLDFNSHTLFFVLLFPFVLRAHASHSLSLPLALFISLSFYFSAAAIHCFVTSAPSVLLIFPI